MNIVLHVNGGRSYTYPNKVSVRRRVPRGNPSYIVLHSFDAAGEHDVHVLHHRTESVVLRPRFSE